MIVVDEAHHIYRPDASEPVTALRELLEALVSMTRPKSVVLLSDVSQSDGRKPLYPEYEMHEMRLEEVIRSTKRIVAGAAAFQIGDMENREAPILPRCNVPDGSHLPTYIFDRRELRGGSTLDGLYATKVVDAMVDKVAHLFPGLSLHNRLAVIVGDGDFRDRLRSAFCLELESRVKRDGPLCGRRFKLVSARDAFSCLKSGSGAGEEEWIVYDTVDAMDGLERLIVIAVGLDEEGSASSARALEVRSRIYRAMTRAQMMACIVNEAVAEVGSSFFDKERGYDKEEAGKICGFAAETVSRVRRSIESDAGGLTPIGNVGDSCTGQGEDVEMEIELHKEATEDKEWEGKRRRDGGGEVEAYPKKPRLGAHDDTGPGAADGEGQGGKEAGDELPFRRQQNYEDQDEDDDDSMESPEEGTEDEERAFASTLWDTEGNSSGAGLQPPANDPYKELKERAVQSGESIEQGTSAEGHGAGGPPSPRTAFQHEVEVALATKKRKLADLEATKEAFSEEEFRQEQAEIEAGFAEAKGEALKRKNARTEALTFGGKPEYMSEELQRECVAVLKHSRAANLSKISGDCAAGSEEEEVYLKNNQHRSFTKETTARTSYLYALWRCENGHVWTATINNRATKGSGCPRCPRAPEPERDGKHMSKELQRECVAVLKHNRDTDYVPPISGDCAAGSEEEEVYLKNNQHRSFTKETAARKSNLYALWRCENGHVWTATINNRATKGIGCPRCPRAPEPGGKDEHLASGAKPEYMSEELQRECVAVLRYNRAGEVPDVSVGFDAGSAEERAYVEAHCHTTHTPSTAPRGSNFYALWRCEKGHVWTAQIASRSKGRGCSECTADAKSGAHVKDRPEMQEKARKGQEHWLNKVELLRKSWEAHPKCRDNKTYKDQVESCSQLQVKGLLECLLLTIQVAEADGLIEAGPFHDSPADMQMSFMGWTGFTVQAWRHKEFKERVEGLFQDKPKKNTLHTTFRRAGLVPDKWKNGWEGSAPFRYDPEIRISYSSRDLPSSGTAKTAMSSIDTLPANLLVRLKPYHVPYGPDSAKCSLDSVLPWDPPDDSDEDAMMKILWKEEAAERWNEEFIKWVVKIPNIMMEEDPGLEQRIDQYNSDAGNVHIDFYLVGDSGLYQNSFATRTAAYNFLLNGILGEEETRAWQLHLPKFSV
eukprot:CAMPEP_0169451768 /NCGR_PEP_ID=MMETSP1042-20121227/13874_1 /TAXON_ID=464988 /ORGANISM="Hemiselmis andersenii, Strain CCMP1180" /LENGTH=1168 /DNA_ID=CAMNT_0009563703 /DNA_START=1 /DNA_END=3508 /DNA_ORIENTATION=-